MSCMIHVSLFLYVSYMCIGNVPASSCDDT